MDRYQLAGWLLCNEVGNQANIRLCEFSMNYIITFMVVFFYFGCNYKNDSSKVEKYAKSIIISARAQVQHGNGRQRYKLNVSRKWSSVMEAHNLI